MHWITTFAAISGLIAVSLGAFGAHVVRQRLSSDMFEVYQTAVQYHWVNTFALFFCGLLMFVPNAPQGLLRNTSVLFIIGGSIFSISLYALSLSGIRWLGAITPIGGVVLLFAWASLAYASTKLVIPS